MPPPRPCLPMKRAKCSDPWPLMRDRSVVCDPCVTIDRGGDRIAAWHCGCFHGATAAGKALARKSRCIGTERARPRGLARHGGNARVLRHPQPHRRQQRGCVGERRAHSRGRGCTRHRLGGRDPGFDRGQRHARDVGQLGVHLGTLAGHPLGSDRALHRAARQLLPAAKRSSSRERSASSCSRSFPSPRPDSWISVSSIPSPSSRTPTEPWPPGLTNQYAALPSLHLGWNLAVGIVLFLTTAHVAVRAFALVSPLAMGFAVLATANHFLLDVSRGPSSCS